MSEAPAPQQWRSEAARREAETEADRHERYAERWSTTPHTHEFINPQGLTAFARPGERVCVICSVGETQAALMDSDRERRAAR